MELANRYDYSTYGGAPLLGIDGACIICHGSSGERAIKNALAARGALRSGEAGFQLGEEQQRFATAQYDARQQLVDLLAGIEAGYANAQRQRAAAGAGAAGDAMTRVINVFPGGPGNNNNGDWISSTPAGAIGANTGAPVMPTVQPPKALPRVNPFPGTKLIDSRWGIA